MNRGGIETFIMNTYRKIYRGKIQFDFLVTRDESGCFDDEIRLMSGKILKTPYSKKVGIIKYIKNVNEFFRNHNIYKIVHCHMNTWSGLFLILAKYAKIPVRIAHSHSFPKGKRFNSAEECKNIFKMNHEIIY